MRGEKEMPIDLKALGAWDRSIARSALVGTVIDFSDDEIKYQTLSGNTTYTIINPALGGIVMLELDGVFTVTLPATVTVVNGDYLPSLGTNYLFLFCIDGVTPAYLGVWNVTV